MATWDEIRKKVKTWDAPHPSTHSSVVSIQEIINTAEEWKMDPNIVNQISKSNFKEIVKLAKQNIRNEEIEKLDMVLHLAAQNHITVLRNLIRPEALEKIQVEVVKTDEGKLYRMEITEEKYDRMVRSLERIFKFIITDGRDRNANK